MAHSEEPAFAKFRQGSGKQKKIPKRNAFSMFMEDRRASVLQTGVVLKRGRADLALLLSDEWKGLLQEEKEKYAEMAVRFNEERARKTEIESENAQDPYSNHGEPSNPQKQNSVIPNSPPVHLEHQTASHHILVELFESEAWITQPIVVCSFTTYFDHDHGLIYFPAEIGLATFSIQDGLMDNFGRVIDPGTPPTGYGLDVAHSVKLLSVPRPGFGSEFSNFESLMLTLESYLEKYRGDFRTDELCVFALDSEFEQVYGCMEWLNQNTGFNIPIRVMSLSQFAYLASANGLRNLQKLKSSSGEEEKDPNITAVSGYRQVGKPLNDCFFYPSSHALTKYGIFVDAKEADEIIKMSNNYKFYDELCCIYHFKKGESIQYCALNKSNRYVFIVLEILTLSNELEIIPGHHFPQVDERHPEIQRRHDWLTRWGITRFEIGMASPPELFLQITPVSPISPRLPRGRKGKFENGKPDSKPEEDQEEGLQNFQAFEQQPEDNSNPNQINELLELISGKGHRRINGRRNPFLGCPPSVYGRCAESSLDATDGGN